MTGTKAVKDFQRAAVRCEAVIGSGNTPPRAVHRKGAYQNSGRAFVRDGRYVRIRLSGNGSSRYRGMYCLIQQSGRILCANKSGTVEYYASPLDFRRWSFFIEYVPPNPMKKGIKYYEKL